MIIGNGLLANAFRRYDNDDTIVFASGVSNSSEKRISEYEREFHLLKSMDKTKKLIYFSTISVGDESLKDTSYIIFKKHIETIIKKNFERYAIFRLPIVVGKTKNPNTFFNYMAYMIRSRQNIDIHKNCFRYLIDIDDLAGILPIIYQRSDKIVMNVCFDNKKNVLEIVALMALEIGIAPNIILLDKGTDYEVDNGDFILNSSKKVCNGYTRHVITKYLQKEEYVIQK